MIATQWHRPLIFQTIDSVRLNNLNLKYPKFTRTESKTKECANFKFEVKSSVK